MANAWVETRYKQAIDDVGKTRNGYDLSKKGYSDKDCDAVYDLIQKITKTLLFGQKTSAKVTSFGQQHRIQKTTGQ